MARSSAQPSDGKSEGGRSASAWFQEIDYALTREETWRERARKVVQRYRDERDSTSRDSTSLSTTHKVNILWSNTEVKKAALYGRTAKPDVRRRFPDAGQRNKNDVNRVAAEVIERGVSFCIDAYDVDTAFERAIDDLLLPGRGVAWVVYEPEIEDDAATDLAPDDGEGDIPSAGDDGDMEPLAAADPADGPEGSRIVNQVLRTEHVYWEDFCHGLSRDWKGVPWVARRHALRKDEFEAQFPDSVKLKAGDNADYELKDTSGKTTTQGEGERFVEIWEVWDKPSRTRIYVARGYRDALQTDDDPYRLEHFFPCPRPMYSVMTTDRLIPEPEFLQYQDQANELDVISTRIMRLTGMLKWNGIYDASIPDNAVLKDMAAADDGEMLAHQNFQSIKDRGGMEAAFGFRPIERIEPVIASLDQRRQSLVQIIYEVTGISDIMRGSTDPNETKGAQQLKAQFGSIRMQYQQREVQRFIRDSYRIMAEILAEHFTADQLEQMTQMDLPTPEEKQAAQMQLVMGAQAAPGQPQGALQPPPAPQPPMGGLPPPPAPVGGAPMPMGMM